MSTWSMLNLQDANSSLMEYLIFFHDYALMILLLIILIIIYMLMFISFNLLNNKYILQNQMIEIIWTLSPMMILIMLALPSLTLLYLMDEFQYSLISIKIMGHQWYWSYEYSDFMNIDFDSFMLSDQKNSNFRLLDVDNRLILPYNLNIRMLFSSTDVIHSWTIPSMGIKVDCIPGRINQALLFMHRPGLFFGQCSEICGLNHSFMPIVVESTKSSFFINWLKFF
nr:cytochrome c oxidase subunit 2 [Euceros kiushuensis]